MKVNILGETAKERLLNTIDLYTLVVESNIHDSIAYFECNGGYEDRVEEFDCVQLKTAVKVLHDFADEMKRLVDSVFED